MASKRPEFLYFVSYLVRREDGAIGFGNVEMACEDGINSIQRIREIENEIQLSMLDDGEEQCLVSIISYQYLRHDSVKPVAKRTKKAA